MLMSLFIHLLFRHQTIAVMLNVRCRKKMYILRATKGTEQQLKLSETTKQSHSIMHSC